MNKKPVMSNQNSAGLLNAKNLTAYIKSISKIGVVTVQFSESIYIPDNYTLFNESDLHVVVMPGLNSNKSLLFFNWTCHNITNNTMTINLTFENPLEISRSGVIKIKPYL